MGRYSRHNDRGRKAPWRSSHSPIGIPTTTTQATATLHTQPRGQEIIVSTISPHIFCRPSGHAVCDCCNIHPQSKARLATSPVRNRQQNALLGYIANLTASRSMDNWMTRIDFTRPSISKFLDDSVFDKIQFRSDVIVTADYRSLPPKKAASNQSPSQSSPSSYGGPSY